MHSSKRALYCLFFVFLMPVSLFVPPTKFLWSSFDSWFFHTCNSYVAHHPVQRIFWALANIKITDLFGAFFLVGCFIIYILEGEGAERRKRIAQFLYMLIWFEITILLSKQCLNPIVQYFSICRHGPSLTTPETSYFLSQLAPWQKVKDFSHSCFPGDHATIVFQWCGFICYFLGKKRGVPITLFSIFFLLPRLISGAHWISDLLVGSLPIVTAALFLATTPLIMDKIMHLLYRLVGYTTQTGDPHVHLQTSS